MLRKEEPRKGNIASAKGSCKAEEVVNSGQAVTHAQLGLARTPSVDLQSRHWDEI